MTDNAAFGQRHCHSVALLDNNGEKWTQATPLAAPWSARYDFQSVVYNNKIWVIAGITGGYALLNDVWYYELPTGTAGKHGKPVSGVPTVTVSDIGPIAIRYSLNITGSVKACVFSCTGRGIRTLWNGVQSAGTHTLVWDGCDAGGRRVGAGAHFVRLRTGDGEVTRKIVVGGH